MRGIVPALPTPHPLGEQLPALLVEDGFAQRLTAAFDECLAPVQLTLDNLTAYFRTNTAPPDFLDWLGEWVGAEAPPGWSVTRRRRLVAECVPAYGRRGTVGGLTEELRALVGDVADVEVLDTGGVSWSATAGSEPPGSAAATVRVRVRLRPPPPPAARPRGAPPPPPPPVNRRGANGSRVDEAERVRLEVERAVAASVPAHVHVELDVSGP